MELVKARQTSDLLNEVEQAAYRLESLSQTLKQVAEQADPWQGINMYSFGQVLSNQIESLNSAIEALGMGLK